MEHEQRTFSEPVELREENGVRHAVGYGVAFNAETVIARQFREVIRPGAFDAWLATEPKPNVRVTFNHDPNVLLGTTASGTAVLRQDARGVAYDTELDPNDPDAVAVRAKLESRKVTGSSFSFRVATDGDRWHAPEARGQLPLREITRAELYELGPVTFPAYESTTAEARSAAAALRSAEDTQQDNGDVQRRRYRLRLTELEGFTPVRAGETHR